MNGTDNSSPVELARHAVELFVMSGEVAEYEPEPEHLLACKAGAFVTLRSAGDGLRGCIGTLEPTRESLALEIIHNAISAATRDPRFTPVSSSELPELTYGVDILSALERVQGVEDLDPLTYGVLVESLRDQRAGVLLPAIDGIETPEQQWRAVHRKAGVALGSKVGVYRFSVTRFGK